MDFATVLIATAGIVVTGSLSRVGANITDGVISKYKELLSRIRNKQPSIAIILEDTAESVDYAQVFPAVEALAKSDLEIRRLLQEMTERVFNDRTVSAEVEHELNKANVQLSGVIENWKGINIKGGNNTIRDNTFQF